MMSVQQSTLTEEIFKPGCRTDTLSPDTYLAVLVPKCWLGTEVALRRLLAGMPRGASRERLERFLLENGFEM